MDEVFIARAGFQVFSVQLKRNLSIWAAALNSQAFALGNPSSHDRGEGMIGDCHLTKEIFYADPQFALAQCAVCTCPPTPRNTAALNKQRCFANALNLGSFS